MGFVSIAIAVMVAVPMSGALESDAAFGGGVGESAGRHQPDQRGLVRRPGSVDLNEEYDLSNLQIPESQIHTLLPRDAIPALTNPATESVEEARRRPNPETGGVYGWLAPDARIISVEINGEVVGVPLGILDFHEVANMTIGDEPVAATYCPLCDSATVISRRVEHPDGKSEVLEFGVSGALYNSNVLMYDRTHRGLWSQLGMRAVSGPLAGTELDHYPIRMMTFDRFARLHPDAPVLSRETGHRRPYGRSPYESYFARDDLMVKVWEMGDELPKKTLGVGVLAEGRSWFVPADSVGESFTLETPMGEVELSSGPAGVSVVNAPEGVHTAQTFYYSWSAFNKQTKVVKTSQSTSEGDTGGDG